MLFTGSPTKLNSAKHRNDTASMTAADCKRRETTKASISRVPSGTRTTSPTRAEFNSSCA